MGPRVAPSVISLNTSRPATRAALGLHWGCIIPYGYVGGILELCKGYLRVRVRLHQGHIRVLLGSY